MRLRSNQHFLSLVLAMIIACLLIPGCAGKREAELRQRSVSLGDSFDEAMLTLGTSRLLAEAYVNMVTVSGEAARLTEHTAVREGSIRWRIMTAGRLDRVRGLADPRLRFAALWTLAVQMRVGFTEGEDSTRFGDQQYRYRDFAKAFEETVVTLGYRAFPDDVIRQVSPEVENLGRTVGVTGWFTPAAVQDGRGALSQLMALPLSPLSGLQGVGDTPAAINRFTDAAREMTRVVENLPERTRWQIELMMLEAETQGAAASFLREMSETRKAIELITNRFPEQARTLLADPNLKENLERISQMMETASQLSREFRQSVADVRQTLLEAQTASLAVQKAAEGVRVTTEVIREDEDDATTRPVKDEKDKFRVTDVEAAAARVELAAAEVRKVIADLRTEGKVPALDVGAQQAEQFVRTVTWSVAAVIALAFLAGLALMVTWRLLPRRGSTPR